MNLLFINMTPIYHNTSALIRMCGFISGANKLGNKCDLLTLNVERDDYSYDATNEDFVKQYVNQYYTFERSGTYNRLKQSKTGAKKNHISRKLLRKIYRLLNIYDAQVINVSGIRKVKIDYDRYDRIISISDPKSSHKLILELIKDGKIKNIEGKWIQCWGDPWFKDSGNTFPFFRRRVFKEEEYYLSMAKKVVYTSPFTWEEQKKLFPAYADKMTWVNQSVKEKVTIQRPKSKPMEKDIVIGYFGNYVSRSRNILPLYEACNRWNHKLKIVGDSDISLKSTANVEVVDMQPLAIASEMEENMDILVCICNRKGSQIPGKIYYSAGYQKPIILAVDGEKKDAMRSYFERFHRYIICDNKADSIEYAIRKAKDEIRNGKTYQLGERFTDVYTTRVLLGDKSYI